MQSVIDKIRDLFSEEYLSHISGIYLDSLKSVKLKGAGKNPVFNVRVEIKPSAYFPAGKSFILCKTFSDILYFPNSQSFVNINSTAARSLISETIRSSFSVASFGCCSKFEQCSDAKKCLHSNPFYSFGCIYRGNLEAGNIFYGVNKNV